MNLNVTNNAAEKIKEFLKKEKAEFMRINVVLGGCSGLMYDFMHESKKKEDDTLVEHNGVSILVNNESLGMIKGSKVDYVEDFDGAGFKVENPNATDMCGCGKSFS
jgi:iron-sulfur cluster assembly accessory protein